MCYRKAASSLAVLTLLGLVACSSSRKDAEPGRYERNAGPATTAELTYGYGPVQDRSFTYQRDVVFIDGGADVIRSASADGLVWTIDGKARGLSKLEVGKVMYATSRAVGRVAALRQSGGDVEVTLAPVGLTDVFRDARFRFDRQMDPGNLVYQEIPKRPGALSVPPEGGSSRNSDRTRELLTVLPASFSTGVSPGGLPPARSKNFEVGVGDWVASPYRESGRLGLRVGYKTLGKFGGSGQNSAGLKVFADYSMAVNKLRIRSDVTISGGRAKPSTFVVEGIKDFAISVSAGAANGADNNAKVRVEVPIELNFPVPGEPLVFTTTFKFIVETALGGKNTTLVGAGQWALTGGIGIVDGALSLPKLTVVKSIMDSITGISIGVSGIVLAYEAKFMFGLGIPGASAGPYSKLVLSLGITNGSALGAPLARCVGATLDGKVGMGLGVNLSSEAKKALEKLLPKLVTFELEALERQESFFHGSQTLPDVPLCRA